MTSNGGEGWTGVDYPCTGRGKQGSGTNVANALTFGFVNCFISSQLSEGQATNIWRMLSNKQNHSTALLNEINETRRTIYLNLHLIIWLLLGMWQLHLANGRDAANSLCTTAQTGFYKVRDVSPPSPFLILFPAHPPAVHGGLKKPASSLDASVQIPTGKLILVHFDIKRTRFTM